MKVTYLLGAGASYKAVPTIVELYDALLEVNNLCRQFITDRADIHSENQKALHLAYNDFRQHMSDGAKYSKLYGTIDTYAKKLFLNESTDLDNLKICLGTFFTIWQDIDKEALKGRVNSKDLQNNILYQDIDDRYFGLIANYLNKKDRKIILDDNVNFISWNYDTQLERAISSYTNSNLKDTLNSHKIYPYDKLQNPKILHLNGIAGLYEKQGKMKTLFDFTENEKNKVLERNLDFLSKLDSEEHSNSNYFTYAWEDDEISKQSIKYAENIMNETNVLVIIGYSFPTFNDSVDKKLFEALLGSKKLLMVYYQDPNASKELLNARFGIDEEKIKIVQDVRQFILPLESHSISKNKPYKRHFSAH